MNEQFRKEFDGVQSFKFFAQNSLSDIEMHVKSNKADLQKIRFDLENSKSQLENFKESNFNFGELFDKIDKKLVSMRGYTDQAFEKLSKKMTLSNFRFVDLDKELQHLKTQLEYQIAQRQKILKKVEE